MTTKRKQVHLRLTLEEWSRAAAIAEHFGLNIPNAIRLLVRQHIEARGRAARARLEECSEALTEPAARRDVALRGLGKWQAEDMVARRKEVPPSVERRDVNLKLSLEEWAAAAALAADAGTNIPA